MVELKKVIKEPDFIAADFIANDFVVEPAEPIHVSETVNKIVVDVVTPPTPIPTLGGGGGTRLKKKQKIKRRKPWTYNPVRYDAYIVQQQQPIPMQQLQQQEELFYYERRRRQQQQEQQEQPIPQQQQEPIVISATLTCRYSIYSTKQYEGLMKLYEYGTLAGKVLQSIIEIDELMIRKKL